MTEKFCSFCGTQRIGAGKFCGGCGRIFHELVNCPTCGQTIPTGVNLNLSQPKTGTNKGSDAKNSASLESGNSFSDPRLVYGTGFTKGDCLNCGSRGKAGSDSCKVCGYAGE